MQIMRWMLCVVLVTLGMFGHGHVFAADAREHADGVERVGERFCANAADQPETRLVTHHAAKRRRADHRARGLAAKRQRNHVVCHR